MNSIIKSKRITSLPILNKGKQKQLEKIFQQNIEFKNYLSKTLNNNKLYQEKLFKNEQLTKFYKEIKSDKYLAWEIQKLVNSDFIEKDKERVYRFFKNFK